MYNTKKQTQMKNLKLTIFSMVTAFIMVTSCTNNESVIEDPQNTEESASLVTALDVLQQRFDANGNFNRESNPAGNIVFDFGFNFVYPLDLSYNNDATVVVESLDDLVYVLLNSSENLYINSIEFSFDIETYNTTTNSIEVITITNETDFSNLITNLDLDNTNSCECSTVYDPVCVEITDPAGTIFTITYPNACYAECDGFTQTNFIDSCETDYTSQYDCFSLNYPVSIYGDNNNTIVINSEEDFYNTTYGMYAFNFAYPFDITLEDGTVVTINSHGDIEAVLEDCYTVENPCDECADQPIDPVCVEIVDTTGNTITYAYDNACYALCDGYTEADFVACNSGNDLCLPSAISDALINNSGWAVTDYNGSTDYSSLEISFDASGSLQWTDSGTTFNGNWSASENPVNGNMLFLSFSGPNLQIASGDWMITDCDLPCSITLQSISNGDSMILSRSCD
ncbi:MAG: hypothetical protein CMC76_09155 [Flavobacteriaceae bacterium]|nr:hypothetical protein [Flavobacteriaceae bacterium]